MGFKNSFGMKKILIIDYKLGNHQSVTNALQTLGYDFLISNTRTDIQNADAYILPGVGAFGEAMENLKDLKIIKVLEAEILGKEKPILGVCLGMQIMAQDSEENGKFDGLGWIQGRVLKMAVKGNIKIPHVGWNNVNVIKKNPLFSKVPNEVNFYFDHSYRVSCNDKYISATVLYGDRITAAISYKNIFGVQFHPEKSQGNGLRVYRGFLNYCEEYKNA